MDQAGRIRLQKRLREDRKFAAEYLNETLQKRITASPEALRDHFVATLAEVIKATGKPILHVARAAGITRQHLYGLLRGEDRNPTLGTLLPLLHELKLDLRIVALDDDQ